MAPRPQQDLVKVPFGPPASGPRLFTWEEIWLRTKKEDPQRELWLVLDRKVYDVRGFLGRHPGGARILTSHVGENVTEAFTAFHADKSLVKKFLNSLQIGELAPDQPSFEPSKNKVLIEDFRELQTTVEKMGLLKPNISFFLLLLLHILLLETAAWLTLVYFGTSLLPFLVSIALLTVSQGSILYLLANVGPPLLLTLIAIMQPASVITGALTARYSVHCQEHWQVQAKWLQHDLGHLSVFQSTKWNHLFHRFVIGHILGASATWWTFLHSQHHAKPNCYSKDPDINMHPYLFTLGKKLSVELGKKKIKYMPYNHQHKYFSFILPPLLIPIYFQWHTLNVSFKKGFWTDLAWIFSFFVRYGLTYGTQLDIMSLLLYYLLYRMTESSWFVWVSQMNHIPMTIDYDQQLDWFSTQLQATCNVEQSLFNDWFTGHLNFQIEHHLFPRMPRHNFSKVAPLVKSFCAKHGIEYKCKPLLTAFADILHSLKDSGELWLDAYLHK